MVPPDAVPFGTHISLTVLVPHLCPNLGIGRVTNPLNINTNGVGQHDEPSPCRMQRRARRRRTLPQPQRALPWTRTTEDHEPTWMASEVASQNPIKGLRLALGSAPTSRAKEPSWLRGWLP